VSLAQNKIPLRNPSFEGDPWVGNLTYDYNLKGWIDWGAIQFPDESPFDVHSVHFNFWRVQTAPQDGKTFVGLVVRQNLTWESIGQKLKIPLLKGKRYELRLYTCMDENYASLTHSSLTADDIVLYTTPAVIGIWGANKPGENEKLLARSEPVDNNDWEDYSFILEPESYFRYLVIEAYYSPGTTAAYAGHVLIDDARLVELE
jgi:hypothetical protein